MTRLNVWSCGGGTQSAAIAALIVHGRLPKPDIALMVDTEREKSSTWEYAHGVLIPALASVGIELHIVKKSDFAKVDLYAYNGDLLLPMYTTATMDGAPFAKMPTFCSDKWKQRVAHRWLRSQGVKSCRTWIGISRDEMRRVRASRLGWNQNCYPLIEAEFALYFDRADCVRTVEESGWPTPPRSSCWMCPNMSDDEWRDMKANQPGDFTLAVELERELREKDAGFYLHEQCVPLDQVDFTKPRKGNGLFDAGCASGMCFV